MLEVISILLLLGGICLVVFGAGTEPPANGGHGSGTFLTVLLEKLGKNSSQKDMRRVDFAVARSTQM